MAERTNHVCCVYRDAAQLLAAGLEWLRRGMDAGERVVYLADRPVEQLHEDIATLPDLDQLIETGRLVLLPLRALYPTGGPVDPESSLAFYAAQTQQALDDGFTGLRVFAEVTQLVREPEWRADHVRWEQVADQFMAEHPLAAYCAYDASVLTPEEAGLLSCVHPVRQDAVPGATFSLYAGKRGWAVEGEVDFFQARLLSSVLEWVPAEEDLVLDLSRLAFVDAAGARAIGGYPGAPGRPVVVRNAPRALSRLWSLIGS